MKFQIPKGLFDILPYGDDQPWRTTFFWQYLEEVIKKITKDYNYLEIRTPIFEKTEVFQRSVGESTDIVSKEMYTFFDRANRSMSLRPEGTAPVMRSFVEKNLFSKGATHKFYYVGPMFRYDRPQAGRYRQHHQFGVEAIGFPNYEQDVEIIDLLNEFYHRLQIKNISLHINSVGDLETRNNYSHALKEYFKPFLLSLSKDSQDRFERNPLRILDSKAKEDKEFIDKAPSILDYLSKLSEKQFSKITHMLKELNIDHIIDHKLVRGLDYYNDVVFEFVCGELGAQNSIGGGGRYNTLIKDFGGPSISGVGFATGLERILQTMLEQNILFPSPPSLFLYFIPLSSDCIDTCFKYATQARHEKIPSDVCLKTHKIQKALQEANKQNASYVILIGEEELESRQAQCKNLETRKQFSLSFDTLIDQIKQLWEQSH